jgi:hypothetical protein
MSQMKTNVVDKLTNQEHLQWCLHIVPSIKLNIRMLCWRKINKKKQKGMCLAAERSPKETES